MELLELYNEVKEYQGKCDKLNSAEFHRLIDMCKKYNEVTGMNIKCSSCNKDEIVSCTRKYLKGIGQIS